MPQYQFADFLVEIQAEHPCLPSRCAAYAAEGESHLPTIYLTAADVARERKLGTDGTDGYVEFVAAFRRLSEILPEHDAMMLHAATVSVNGRGVAFLAPSGVGKTTQLKLWRQKWGDRLIVVNGDKPIVRFFVDGPYAYGTPWAGKEGWHTPTRIPLTDLCFVERAQEDSIAPMDTHTALGRLAQQIMPPKTEAAAEKTLEMLDRLLRECRLWRLCCTMSPNAAEVASAAIMEETV